MTNLVFLEAATQSEGAATIIESNEALINFATAEVDSLVEEQALHTSWHVGSFVEESFDITYENMTDPISDIVVEATSIFADVIASDGYSDSEKKELIEGYAHIIAMGDGELIAEGIPDGVVDIGRDLDHAVTSAATHGRLAGSAASGAIGAIGGAAIGGSVGAFAKLFSKERKAWKALVKQEKEARKKGANAATLKKIEVSKAKARTEYIKARNAAVKKGAKIGAVAGGVAGALNGYSLGYSNATRNH